MAAVDLYGGDAERIRKQYQTSLGRDASDDEVSGWLSGTYGGGNVDSYIQQIASSHEAQQKQPQGPIPSQPPTVGQPNPNVSGTLDPGAGDPMAQARQGLTNTYLQFTGRDPAAGDIDKWLSGGYGYGSGVQDYDKYVAAIMGSPEARAYRPPTPQGDYQNLDWWQSQGTPAIDIFDPLSGQLKPGWARTGRGYERTGATGGAPGAPGGATGGMQPFPNGDPFAFITSLTNGRPPTPEQLEAMAPELAKYGITVGSKGSRGWSDTITLPDGRMYDLIEGAGIGTGKRWQFLQVGGPGYTGGVGGGPLPGNQHSDPYTQMLEQLIKSRLGMLQQGVNDPYRDQYMGALQNRANALGAAEPAYERMIKYLEQRFGELQGPGYTGAENEVIRTGALDPIERDRSAARQRMLERLSARGITPDSGIAQQALLEVDKAFDEMRAATQTTLTTHDLQRREDRSQRAERVSGALYDIPQARAREQLDVFSAMDLIEGVMRQEEEARSREAIGYGGVLADLGPQRMQLAMQASGMGGSYDSLANTLFGVANLNQNAALLNQRNQSQWLNAMGSIAYTLSKAGI